MESTVNYVAWPTENTALRRISNTPAAMAKAAADPKIKLTYNRPESGGNDVVVYVMEYSTSYQDFPNDPPPGDALSKHERMLCKVLGAKHEKLLIGLASESLDPSTNAPPFTKAAKLIQLGVPPHLTQENVNDIRRILSKPAVKKVLSHEMETNRNLKRQIAGLPGLGSFCRIYDNAWDEHGPKVTTLLAGYTYGAAPGCKIIVVPRERVTQTIPTDPSTTKPPTKKSPTKEPPTDTWEVSLRAAVTHFTALKAKNKKTIGLMNLSVGFEYTKARAEALQAVCQAGLIIVGAAENGNRDIATYTDNEIKFPERLPKSQAIIIGALDNSGDRQANSDYGERVDYWVEGNNLPFGKDENGLRMDKGTSFATPIAVGVIACMLSARQANNNMESIRNVLNSWADENNGLKHLKNGPGLNVVKSVL